MKLQREATIARELAKRQTEERKKRNAAAKVQLLCRSCFMPVALGSDIRIIDNEHYVNINPDFK